MILVDQLRTFSRHRVRYCHMVSTLPGKEGRKELHDFAEKIGVKKCWFQLSRIGIPHYDLSSGPRALALVNGALAVDNRELFRMVPILKKAYPKDPTYKRTEP